MDALARAGCDDATFAERDGVAYADFDRRRPTFAAAVGSAIRAVETSVPSLRVVRLEPDDLVAASTIAVRTKRSRESVRLLAGGVRGPGSFPAPVAWINGRTRVWRWAEVARWFSAALGEEVEGSPDAWFIASLNAVLDLRSNVRAVARGSDRDEIMRMLGTITPLRRTS